MKFLKISQSSYSLLAFLAFNLSEKFVRQGFRSAKKKKNANNEKTTLTTPSFSILKVSSCQTLRGSSISENVTEGN